MNEHETDETDWTAPRRTFLRSTGVAAASAAMMSGVARGQEGGQGGDGNGQGDDDQGEDDDGAQGEDDGDCYTTDIDNEFTPLPVGRQLTLEGEEEDEGETILIRLQVTSLDQTEEVLGITTRVMEEREWETDPDDPVFDQSSLIEVSRNFMAQTCDGTVWYFGEDVDIYEDGEIVGHEGEWRADGVENGPGIFMPRWALEGTIFQREIAPDIAADMAEITAVDETVEVPYGTFDGCIELLEWNPVEGQGPEDGEIKFYAPDVGVIVDEALELIEYEPGEGSEDG